jgi:mannose PTS system EIID component
VIASRRSRWAVLVRALAVQGSWNYETLLGTGFGFSILPALRRLYGDRADLDAAIRRHESAFNTHPYLAPLALGAVIRLEADGEDPEVIARFKAALRSSLGTLGDQLVWAGWRPVCVLAALALFVAGAPWYVPVVAFLVLYNIGHLVLMSWGLALGLSEGRNLAESLRGSMVRKTQPRLMAIGAFTAAFSATLIVTTGVPHLPGPGAGWGILAVAVAASGATWGDRVRRGAAAAVAGLVLLGLALGMTGAAP